MIAKGEEHPPESTSSVSESNCKARRDVLRWDRGTDKFILKHCKWLHLFKQAFRDRLVNTTVTAKKSLGQFPKRLCKLTLQVLANLAGPSHVPAPPCFGAFWTGGSCQVLSLDTDMCVMASYSPGSHYGHLGKSPYLGRSCQPTAGMGHLLGHPIPRRAATSPPSWGARALPWCCTPESRRGPRTAPGLGLRPAWPRLGLAWAGKGARLLLPAPLPLASLIQLVKNRFIADWEAAGVTHITGSVLLYGSDHKASWELIPFLAFPPKPSHLDWQLPELGWASYFALGKTRHMLTRGAAKPHKQ